MPKPQEHADTFTTYNLKVVFSWPPRSSKSIKTSSNTLYSRLYICQLQDFEKPTLHFGNFVTARVAKSIISSKCVFLTPSMDSLGYSKLKSYIWT